MITFSVTWITFLIIWFVCSLISTFFVIEDWDSFKDDTLNNFILCMSLLYSPTNIIIIPIMIGVVIGEYIKDIKSKRILLKERKKKIKLGIIKINDNDPYGEEDWSDEK